MVVVCNIRLSAKPSPSLLMENVPSVKEMDSLPQATQVKDDIRLSSPPEKDAALEVDMLQSNLRISLVIFSLCASVFLAALDITIISTILPTIASHFHSKSAYTWVGSAYTLAEAASTPIWGKLSDIWGRKPLLLAAAAMFFLGSTLCGTAINIDMLIAGRAVQGLAGGGLLTLVNICISDLFSMRNRAKYYGIIGMTWAVASATGPVLGGVLAEKASWRWCFYLNLPITGLAFFIIAFALRLHTPKTTLLDGLLAVDWLGSLSVAGMNFGGVVHPWSSPTVLCLLILGPLIFGIFILIEWKIARYPLMPLVIFQNYSNLACLAMLGTYFLPLYFQATLGATALLSGVWLIPLALSMSFASGLTGWFISATGHYMNCIQFGYFFSVLGFGLLLDLPKQKTWTKIIIYQIICGIGIGPNFQALLLAIQNQVEPKDYATATALFGFTRNIATSIGIVVGNVVFQNHMLKEGSNLKEVLDSRTAELFIGGAAESSVFLINRLSHTQKTVTRDAYYSSLRDVWILAVALAGAGLLLISLIKGKELEQTHGNIKTGLDREPSRKRDKYPGGQ
ncbi:MFS multidrug transporter-like protein [Xylogone sp. PMI_703]|nr:MFS multidrug transporter-like protein [Xylogone sp. PMI_703]